MLIRGDKLSLRRSGRQDVARAYEWFAFSELTPTFLGAPLYPELPLPSREGFEARYPPLLFEPGNPYDGRALIISVDGEDIGVVVYGAVRLLQGSVELEMWLGERRFSGRGHGSEALRLACTWLHDELGVDDFVVRPSRRNVRALRAFRRAGFRTLRADPEQALRHYGLARHPLPDSELMVLNLPAPRVELQPDPQCEFVFLDTEFTDLLAPRLISVGAVGGDGQAFYREISGWAPGQASEFVTAVVVPLLEGRAGPLSEVRSAFFAWLQERPAQRPVTVITDSAYDRWALAELLGRESLPDGLRWQRVPLPYEQLDAVVAKLGLRRHHALDDARGLRQALLRPAP